MINVIFANRLHEELDPVEINLEAVRIIDLKNPKAARFCKFVSILRDSLNAQVDFRAPKQPSFDRSLKPFEIVVTFNGLGGLGPTTYQEIGGLVREAYENFTRDSIEYASSDLATLLKAA